MPSYFRLVQPWVYFSRGLLKNWPFTRAFRDLFKPCSHIERKYLLFFEAKHSCVDEGTSIVRERICLIDTLTKPRRFGNEIVMLSPDISHIQPRFQAIVRVYGY